MNISAANALLKILEEPPTETRFILISDDRSGIPLTILSRVSAIPVAAPDLRTALEWMAESGISDMDRNQLLGFAEGAPLRALQLYKSGFIEKNTQWKSMLLKLAQHDADPTVIAAAIGKENATDFIAWLEKILCDVTAVALGKTPPGTLGVDSEAIHTLTERLFSRGIWDMIRKLQVYLRKQRNTVDELLFLEDILIAIRKKS